IVHFSFVIFLFMLVFFVFFFFFQAEDGIRDLTVTGVQTCALPISPWPPQVTASPTVGPTPSTTRRATGSRRARTGQRSRTARVRSEERRVGKECRSRGAPYD